MFTCRQHIGTKTIRLDVEICERIKAEKRQDETFSEVIERLIDEVSLLELTGGLSEAEAEAAKAAIRTNRRADRLPERQRDQSSIHGAGRVILNSSFLIDIEGEYVGALAKAREIEVNGVLRCVPHSVVSELEISIGRRTWTAGNRRRVDRVLGSPLFIETTLWIAKRAGVIEGE